MKKPVILLCIMILALCAGCGSSGDVSESATESGTVTDSSTDTAVTEEETSEEAATEEAVTEDTAATATEAENISKYFYNEFIDDYNSFEVTSTSMNNGVWDDAISLSRGSNKSPQLQWDAVDGAGLYVIIMDDLEAWDLVHWVSDNVTETSLDEGWAPESEYVVGPNPQSGSTHTYEVYVVALKAPVERVKVTPGISNMKFEENFKALDIDAQGNSGNIIAVGRLTGTYSN